MKSKILKGLKETYSNLGLSEKILEKKAEQLAKWVPADADDAKVQEFVDAVKDELVETQKFMDKRANDAVDKYKKDHPEKKDDDTDPKKTEGEGSNAELLSQLKAMQEEIAGLKAANSAKDFDAKVLGFAKELQMDDFVLGFAKTKLSPDMEDEAIKSSLGATMQEFIKRGMVKSDDSRHETTNEETLRKQAQAFAESFGK